jgi:hypothetical protein
MAEGWKLEESEKDNIGRSTGPVRRAFEAWSRRHQSAASLNRSRVAATDPRYRERHGEFPYIATATRIAWLAWRGAIAAVVATSPDSLRCALAIAVLKGDEAAAGALVDLLLESGVGTGRKGAEP